MFISTLHPFLHICSAVLPERFEELFSPLITTKASLTDESEELGIPLYLRLRQLQEQHDISVISQITATLVLCASRTITAEQLHADEVASQFLLHIYLCTSRSTVSASSSRLSLHYRRGVAPLTGLLQNPIQSCVQTNLSWISRQRFHSRSSL